MKNNSIIYNRFPNVFQFFCSDESCENDNHYFYKFMKKIPSYAEPFLSFIDDNLSYLNEQESEIIFKNKCEKYIVSNKKDWSQFIDIINELEGYKYLKQKFKCTKVNFIAENSKQKTPDIEGVKIDKKYYLEVKTIHLSDYEMEFINSKKCRSVPQELAPGLFDPKLKSTIENAMQQLSPFANETEIKILMLIISLDSDAPETIKKFTRQIKNYVQNALDDRQNFKFTIRYKYNGRIYSHDNFRNYFGI